MHSDNGTAFISSASELKQVQNQLNKMINEQPIIEDYLRDSKISWKFVPPNAPHQSGFWEAAVKSAKHHLYRVMGAHILHLKNYRPYCVK